MRQSWCETVAELVLTGFVCLFQPALLFTQASRILANLIVAGGSVIVRAAATAWRQAVVSKLQNYPMPSKL